MPKEKIEYELTSKQWKAFELLTNNEINSVLFGGAKGGGKSFLLCLWAFHWAKWLIDFFGILKVKFPLPVGFIGRKQSVDFTDTTLETFKKIIPSGSYEIKPSDKEIIIENRVKILYGGLDYSDVVKKFNSAEFAFGALDKAEETERADVSILQATLRLTYNNKKPPYKFLYTANPAECWLKDDFIRTPKTNCHYIPALCDENPYLPSNYKETLRDAFSYDPALLKAYLLGDWDAFSSIQGYLISYQDVNKARVLEIDEDENAIKIVANDVATKHGENLTGILSRQGHMLDEIVLYKHILTTETAQNVRKKYSDYEADTIVVDADGVGEGVSDMLIGYNLPLLEFHGGYGYKAMDVYKFKNLRSQFYWIVAKKLEKGMYSFKKLPQKEFELLRKQLCSIKVKLPDALGRIQIETKEDMLARGLERPDLADLLMMSEYAYFMGKMSDIKSYAYR